MTYKAIKANTLLQIQVGEIAEIISQEKTPDGFIRYKNVQRGLVQQLRASIFHKYFERVE